MTSTRRAALAAGAAALAAAAFPPHVRAQTAAKLTVANTSHDATSWMLAVANSGGFYDREKVAVDFIYTGNNATSVQQLVAKGLDVAKTTMETTIRAIENEAPIVMVASTMLPYPYSFMAAPSIGKPADLKGKRVISDLPSSILTYTFKRWALSKGLGADDVDLVYDGASPNRFAALVNGTVVAAPLNQPLDIIATSRGYKRLLDMGSANKSAGFSCFAVRRDWLTESANGDALRGFLRAMARATDYFYDRKNRESVVAMLVDFSKIEAPIAQQVYDYYTGPLRPFAKNGAIPDDSVKGNIDYLVESGVIKTPAPPVSRFVDRRFIPR